MYKVKRREYLITDDYNCAVMNYQFLINTEDHLLNRKHYKINRTRDTIIDEKLEEFLQALEDDE